MAFLKPIKKFYSMPRLQRAVHLVLDFDSTLTTHDTMHLLREIPLQRNARLKRELRVEDLYPVPEWTALEQAYLEDYDRHRKANPPSPDFATMRRAGRKARRLYSEYLASRKEVELLSLRRAEDWDVFKGARREDVRRGAETVVEDGRLTMREYWPDLLQMFKPQAEVVGGMPESRVSIISVNWSASFIRECLLADLKRRKDHDEDLATMIEYKLKIHANDIAGLDDQDGSSGDMVSKVHTSADKLEYLPPLSFRENPDYPDRIPDHQESYLVYVGDSSTDFDCLRAADTGIWLDPAETLEHGARACLEAFRPLHLFPCHIDEDDQILKGEGGDEVAWAQDLEQVAGFLARLRPVEEG